MELKNVIQWYVKAAVIGLVVFAGGCKENGPIVEPEPVITYKQYGTPFQEIPATQDIVMYEVNLRAFSPGGNLQGVTARLDNIRDLGVNVIWLMPIHPIGEINSVNSPYSIKDYKSVGAEFGSRDDLRKLTDEAHARGIAVIMDWVANHTAWDNPWITNRNWYTQDALGNIIHPSGTNWQDVADLNYDNVKMREAMIDAMKYWAYEANIDGFRCDFADGVPFDFWKQAFDSLAVIPNREFILFAEGTRADHFDAGFDLNFGWEFYGGIKDVFKNQPVNKIFTSHNNEYDNIPAGKHWVRFTTNHDESAWDATPITLFGGVDGALAASVVTIFTGGVPLIYAGQEVGTAANVPFFNKSNTNWNNNPAMREAYEKILQFYAVSEVARIGNNTSYPHNDIVCLKKSLNGETLLILVNVRNFPVNFTIPTGLQNTTWENVMTLTDFIVETEVQLGAYSYLILLGK
ncbi:MAG: alpha-amylase family glycosyl hydrolase [Bacteroidia bacterium]|nr:alpha-amylase family glycosyl hydrolase [Bacteroidia bacterium]